MPMFIWPLLLLAAATLPVGLARAGRAREARARAAAEEQTRRDAAEAHAEEAETARLGEIAANPLLLLGALALRAEQNVLGPLRDLIRRLRHEHSAATAATKEAAAAEAAALEAAPAWSQNTVLRIAALVCVAALAVVIPVVYVLEYQSFEPTQGKELALLFAPLGILVVGFLGVLGAKSLGIHPTAEEWSRQKRLTVGLVTVVLLGYVLQTLLTFAPYRSSGEHDTKVINAQALVDRDAAMVAEAQPVSQATLDAHKDKLTAEKDARTAAANGDRLYVGVAVMAELIALEGAWQAWYLLPAFVATRRRKRAEATEQAASETVSDATDDYRGQARRVVADLYEIAQRHQIPDPGNAITVAMGEAQYAVQIRQMLDQVDGLDGLGTLTGTDQATAEPVQDATDAVFDDIVDREFGERRPAYVEPEDAAVAEDPGQEPEVDVEDVTDLEDTDGHFGPEIHDDDNGMLTVEEHSSLDDLDDA